MGLLDGLLTQMAGHDVAGLGAKVGLTPDQVQAALAALTHAAPQPGDTAQTAAQHTGLPVEALQQVLAHVGGEGALGQLAGVLGGTGDGGAGLGGGLGGLAGMFGGNRG